MITGIPDSISSRTYQLIIGGLILYGFALNVLFVEAFSNRLRGLFEKPLMFLLIYVVFCIAGIALTRTNNPVMNFIGFNVTVAPIGLLLAVTLPGFPKKDILTALIITAAVAAAMIALSTLFPNFFAKLGRTLIASLLIGIAAEVVAFFLGYRGNVFSLLFVILFSLYVGFDWYRAQQYPKTFRNAVIAAIDIYLDVINIFIRVLSLVGKRD